MWMRISEWKLDMGSVAGLDEAWRSQCLHLMVPKHMERSHFHSEICPIYASSTSSQTTLFHVHFASI